MNFKHDIAMMAKQTLLDNGIAVDNNWDDHTLCINYFDVVNRWFVNKNKCKVVYSKELLEKLPTLTQEERDAIRDIEYKLNNGISLTSYMSKSIWNSYIRKSDVLLKNWNIYHLHLEQLDLLKRYYTKPNLLFFQPKGNMIHFIDVIPHPRGSSWFNRDLLEIVYSNWPWLLIFIKGITPNLDIPDEEIHNLSKNINTIISFHGGALMPSNFGVMSSGHSHHAASETIKLFNLLEKCEKVLMSKENIIKSMIQQELGVQIDNSLDYKLTIDNDIFMVTETNSQWKCQLFKLYRTLCGL